MTATQTTTSEAPSFAELFDSIARNVEQVIQGKADVVDAGADLPAVRGSPPHRGRARRRQDEPGQGARHSIDCTWKRVQFTPDLLPSDVVGVTVWNRGTDRFEFRPGPVFANIVLGDEINRASPKTQSALLEAMEERQVTVDGTTYPLEPPFMVIATQNPVDHEGTYPLPESQLDRFLMRISIGYPDRECRDRDPRRPRRTHDPRRTCGPWPRPSTCESMVQAVAHRPRRAGAEGLPRRPGRRVPPPPGRARSACHPGPRSALLRASPRPCCGDRAATT